MINQSIFTNKPFSWQEKGWDEFANLTDIPEPSLISPLRRERLIFNNDFTFLILSFYMFSSIFNDLTIISLLHNIFSCR